MTLSLQHRPHPSARFRRRSKQEIDAEFEAQQQLLAFRRQKAEARMVRIQLRT
jgi:hypothetical protein